MHRLVGECQLPGACVSVVNEDENLFHAQQEQFCHRLQCEFPWHFVADGVELSRFFLAVADDAVHDGLQFLFLVGFQQEIVGSASDGIQHVVREGGVEDCFEREVQSWAYGVEELRSGASRHFHVKEEDVGLEVQQGQGGFRVGGEGVNLAHRFKAFEVVGECLPCGEFVIDDENNESFSFFHFSEFVHGQK